MAAHVTFSSWGGKVASPDLYLMRRASSRASAGDTASVSAARAGPARVGTTERERRKASSTCSSKKRTGGERRHVGERERASLGIHAREVDERHTLQRSVEVDATPQSHVRPRERRGEHGGVEAGGRAAVAAQRLPEARLHTQLSESCRLSPTDEGRLPAEASLDTRRFTAAAFDDFRRRSTPPPSSFRLFGRFGASMVELVAAARSRPRVVCVLCECSDPQIRWDYDFA